MAYLGRALTAGNYLKLDDLSSQFNGTQKTFNLTSGGQAFYPGSAFSILVSLGGVIQEPESAYQINQSQITFAVAPQVSDDFFCIVLGVALGVGVPGEGTVSGSKLTKPFNYDNGLLYLDDTNNRVGINSTTPGYTFDVNGDARIAGILTVGTSSLTLNGATNQINGVTISSGIVTATNIVATTGTFTGNVSIGGTLTYEDVTNIDSVGIITARSGVIVNSGGLVVTSGVSTFTNIVVSAGSTSAPSISPTGDSNTGIFFPAPDTVAIAEGGVEALRVDSSGNIGIGSASPFAKLDIVGGGTAQLQVTGTEADVWLKSTGPGNTVWRILGSIANNTHRFRIYDQTNNAERFAIDSSGRVTIPNQPAFCARSVGAGSPLSGNIVLNTIILNNGNHYSTSTGNFTAPIAGMYYFSFTGFTENSSSGSADISIQKNGTPVVRTYTSESTGTYRPFAVDCIVSLAVNDTVRPNSGIELHANLNPNFSGFLIG